MKSIPLSLTAILSLISLSEAVKFLTVVSRSLYTATPFDSLVVIFKRFDGSFLLFLLMIDYDD